MEDVLKVKVRINPLALLSSTGEAEFQHLKKKTFIKTTPKGWKTVIEYLENLPKIHRTGG